MGRPYIRHHICCITLEKTIYVMPSKFDVEFEVPTTSMSFRHEGGQEKEFTFTSNI